MAIKPDVLFACIGAFVGITLSIINIESTGHLESDCSEVNQIFACFCFIVKIAVSKVQFLTLSVVS